VAVRGFHEMLEASVARHAQFDITGLCEALWQIRDILKGIFCFLIVF
jgi:hypothetical protein